MQLAEGIQSAARGFREFDEEHAVVHNATEGVKQAWRDLRQASDWREPHGHEGAPPERGGRGMGNYNELGRHNELGRPSEMLPTGHGMGTAMMMCTGSRGPSCTTFKAYIVQAEPPSVQIIIDSSLPTSNFPYPPPSPPILHENDLCITGK